MLPPPWFKNSGLVRLVSFGHQPARMFLHRLYSGLYTLCSMQEGLLGFFMRADTLITTMKRAGVTGKNIREKSL